MRMIGHSLHISIASILALLNSAAGLNIAVTGAHGYLGAEICWQAAAEGHSVRAVWAVGLALRHCFRHPATAWTWMT